MKSESKEKQNDYFILGNRLFVNYNHEKKIQKNEDGEEIVSWVCDQVIIPKNSSRSEMIEAIIRNKYHSYGAELSAINGSDTEKNDYFNYRQMAINIANNYFGIEIDVKEEKKQEINQYRDYQISLSFDFQESGGETRFRPDLRSATDISNIMGIALSAKIKVDNGANENEHAVEFRASDNKTYVIEYAEAIRLGEEVKDFIEKNYKIAWFHKDAVDSLNTKKKVRNYSYRNKWSLT